jgi:hypothetical protein
MNTPVVVEVAKRVCHVGAFVVVVVVAVVVVVNLVLDRRYKLRLVLLWRERRIVCASTLCRSKVGVYTEIFRERFVLRFATAVVLLVVRLV